MTRRLLTVTMGLLLLFSGVCVAQELPMDSDQVLNVHLQDDGRLSGRLRIFYATGKSEPADAEITFIQDGNLVDATKTDDLGHFHVTGLEPGSYVAQASIDSGTTNFAVNVAEFADGIAAEAMFLDATLTPTPDGEIVEGEVIEGDCADCGEIVAEAGVIEEGFVEEGLIGDEIIGDCGCLTEDCGCIIEEEIIEETACCDGGFSSGGCCGGGGGGIGGGLVGLAGLAGLAGLGGDDDGDPVFVSQFAP